MFSSHLYNSHTTLVCHDLLSGIVSKISAADFVITPGSKLRCSSVK